MGADETVGAAANAVHLEDGAAAVADGAMRARCREARKGTLLFT